MLERIWSGWRSTYVGQAPARVDPDAADEVVAGLVADGHTASVIGRAVEGDGRISISRR